jgi:hypothetical protein
MFHRKITIPLLLMITGASFFSKAEEVVLTVWKIGFKGNTIEMVDSSSDKLRYEYPRLYCSGLLTIAAHLGGEDKIVMRARMEEVREVLWEGGIPPENIQLADFGKEEKLQALRLKKGECYLVFVSREPVHIRMLGRQTNTYLSGDTVISRTGFCYLKYRKIDYHLKTQLPEIHLLNHDAVTKDEMGLYEKVNTRGFSRELAFFQLTKNDSDHIADDVIFPLDVQSMKSSMRLDRYDKEHAAWMPVRDAGLKHVNIKGQACIGVRINASGIYRLLADPGKHARVLYFKAPERMAFVKAELVEGPMTVYQGVFTDAETGVVFVLPEKSSPATCRFVLKDATGKIHYLPEGDWSALVNREVKISKHNRRRITIHGKPVALPPYAYRLDKELHEVRTMALDHIK